MCDAGIFITVDGVWLDQIVAWVYSIRILTLKGF